MEPNPPADPLERAAATAATPASAPAEPVEGGGGRAPRAGWRPIWREGFEVGLSAIILALFVRTFLFQAFNVPSDSMAPTLRTGDQVLVNKFVFRGGGWPLPARAPRVGDLALFRLSSEPDDLLVKRCVATEGDRVELIDKQLVIDGRAIDEPWVVHRDENTYPRSRFVPRELRARDNFGPRTVPPGHFFFLGDNRDSSRDSRSFGAVPRAAVVGRPVLVFWSRGAAGGPVRGGALARSRLGRLLSALFATGEPERGLRFAR